MSVRDHGLLAIADRVGRQKARRAVATQIGDDHPVAGRRQQGRDIDEAVDVVRPAVQQDDRRPVGRAGFRVADVESAGVDLLERGEGCVRPRSNRGYIRGDRFSGYGFGAFCEKLAR